MSERSERRAHRLAEAQIELVRPHVRGRDVVDWGCGFTELSMEFLRLGATSLTGVDRDGCAARFWEEEIATRAPGLPPVRFVHAYVEDTPGAMSRGAVSVISWPVNWRIPGLVRRLEQSDTVIYVGVNNRTTVCGDLELWEHLVQRPLLGQMEGHGDLIVYGPGLETREPTAHEARALEYASVSRRWGID